MDSDLIPWTSRNEWITVYEDVYSGDYKRTSEAVKILTEWKQFMKHDYRPGMDCTRGLLQVALKDKFMFKDSEESFEIAQLQLLYSAEIMRFLNLVCDPMADDRKLSLYGKARSLGIPDWVVNVRHQMAHRGSLPAADILRMAVHFILNWLKDYYWEVEKAEMKEVILEDPKTVVPVNLGTLLNIYILLREQSILGFKFVGEIQDPDVKEIIINTYSYSLREVKIRCKPWDINDLYDEDYKGMKKFRNLPLTKAIFIVIKMIKPFFKYDEVYGVDTMDIFISKMIDDSVEHNGMRREVWKSLLKTMHSWDKLPLMISYLTDRQAEMSGECSYQAGIWCVELCKALQKRFKVECFSDSLIKEATTSEFNEIKESNLKTQELKEFTKLLRKRKLDVFEESDEKRLTFIYLRIERQHLDLREVLRLREPLFPDRWEVLDLIHKMASNPTDFSEPCLIALHDILKWPFSEANLKNLISLTKLYQGDGVLICKKKRIYTVDNLETFYAKKTNSETEVQ